MNEIKRQKMKNATLNTVPDDPFEDSTLDWIDIDKSILISQDWNSSSVEKARRADTEL